MFLSEVFEQLTYGELSQISLGGAETGGIAVADYAKVISHINLGMTALYVKFPIKEKEVVVGQITGQAIYELDSKYSVSANDPSVPVPYIIDTVENPFLDDILRIDQAFDEAGDTVPLNDPNTTDSVFTPSYKTLQIPLAETGNSTFLTYRARHISLPLNPTDPTTVSVDLPEVLLEALLAYVGSRVYSARTGDAAQNEGMLMLQKYERICAEVEDRNLLNNGEQDSNIKLDENGWV